jgi:ribosome biogenesis GTPase / thiamine phosphate phosphatase
MFSNDLKKAWGFHPMQDAFFSSLQETKPSLLPARITFSSHDQYRILILGETTEHMARARGHFYRGDNELPVVGDWVAVELLEGDHQSYPIEAILPQTSSLRRQDTQRGYQTVIANVDIICLVTSFNHDMNVRRLERGLAMIQESRAKPVIVINKNDLLPATEIAAQLDELKNRFGDVPIISSSTKTGEGIKEIIELFSVGQSVTFLGMSGVGKSSLINAILGEDLMHTKEIRQGDSRGKHTTTHRELMLTKKGFWLMDTPGIREFSYGGDEESLVSAFDDIAELMAQCRFSDCSHVSEPGCQILSGLASGSLDKGRWENFLKIKKEMEYQANKRNKVFQSQKKQAHSKLTSSIKKRLKDKGRK